MTLSDLQHAWPWAVALVAALTVLAHVLQGIAHATEKWALASKAKWDDRPAHWLVVVADGLVWALGIMTSALPKIGALIPKAPQPPDASPPSAPPSSERPS